MNVSPNNQKILDFLRAKTTAVKASQNKNSTAELDYKIIKFPTQLGLSDISTLRKIEFETDWHSLMIIRRQVINQGIKLNMHEHYIHVEFILNGNYLLSKYCKINPKSEKEALYDAIICAIDFYNDHQNLFI